MIRPRHPRARSLARPSVALVSVLALLAFACFPVLAQANPPVYEVEQTQLPGSGGGGNSPSHHNNTGGSESSPGAKQSTAPGAGSGAQNSQNGSSNAQNGASGGTNPSSPGGGSEAQGQSGKDGVGSGKPVGSGSNAVQLGEPKSAETGSGGSSPLVPILIAVAVLAAISVGAVLVRQRRGTARGFSLKRG
jgi:cobalamin biosynthesis Mg chelatase CobN